MIENQCYLWMLLNMIKTIFKLMKKLNEMMTKAGDESDCARAYLNLKSMGFIFFSLWQY